MKTTDRVMQIYLAGLKRIDEAPDYHYKDSKKKKSSHGHGRVPVRGIREVSIHHSAKKALAV